MELCTLLYPAISTDQSMQIHTLAERKPWRHMIFEYREGGWFPNKLKGML